MIVSLILLVSISAVFGDNSPALSFSNTSSLSSIADEIEAHIQRHTKNLKKSEITTMVIPKARERINELKQSLDENIWKILQFNHYKNFKMEQKSSYLINRKYIVSGIESIYKESTDELLVFSVDVEYSVEIEAEQFLDTLRDTSAAIKIVFPENTNEVDILLDDKDNLECALNDDKNNSFKALVNFFNKLM